MQQYGSLALQEQHDQQIEDSMEAVLHTQLSTYVQMSGGELDIAYRIFFGPKFRALFEQMDTDIASFAGLYPDVFSTISATQRFRDFMEMLDITQDDISQVHAAYMDKGKRIEAYLGLLHQLEKRRFWLNKYLGQYALLSKFPTHEQAERVRKQIQKSYSPNDGRIVRQILEKF
jgi:membrane-bound lytic murein transglycosylase